MTREEAIHELQEEKRLYENAKRERSLEEIAKELRRIREVMDGHTRFIKCNKFMTSEEFKKLEADLKRQDPNIILLPPGVVLDNGQGRANNV